MSIRLPINLRVVRHQKQFVTGMKIDKHAQPGLPGKKLAEW